MSAKKSSPTSIAARSTVVSEVLLVAEHRDHLREPRRPHERLRHVLLGALEALAQRRDLLLAQRHCSGASLSRVAAHHLEGEDGDARVVNAGRAGRPREFAVGVEAADGHAVRARTRSPRPRRGCGRPAAVRAIRTRRRARDARLPASWCTASSAARRAPSISASSSVDITWRMLCSETPGVEVDPAALRKKGVELATS